MIYKLEGDFLRNVKKYLNIVRNFLNRRYKTLSGVKASTNPLSFTQGGMHGGFLKPTDNIGSMVDQFTASFGITALNELNVLHEGIPMHESDGKFINSVVDFISDTVSQFREEDGRLYALYGVPAESLCGTQLRQFRDKYGIIEGVSDREYFTNSFHMHVTAPINPFTKQDLEYDLYHKINGGHINYSRIDITRPEIVKGIVMRAMSLGFYSGVNATISFCEACGNTIGSSHTSCPICNSNSIMSIDRVCGYIGFQKQSGSTRFNDAKLAEVKDRQSM